MASFKSTPKRATFQTTQWSVVIEAAATGASATAFECLYRSYWYPLYAFVRRSGVEHHDAVDITQGFFLHILEKRALTSVGPERGRFRTFLLASIKNFLANDQRRQRALKRGGDRRILSIDHEGFEIRYAESLVDDSTPEQAFDRSWAVTLLTRVLHQLRAAYTDAGREELFHTLNPFLTSELPRKRLSGDLGISPAAVTMSMSRMRKKYRQLLVREIAETVSQPSEVADELKQLMRAVGGS